MIERLRALRMDTTPLRTSRDFRLLFLAGTVFYFGAMITYVAVPYQVYRLTGSNFAVGAIGLVEIVPIIVFGLYGGALADHVDRRKLLIWSGVAQAVFTAVLAVNAFREEPDLWVIFVVAVALSSASALQRPSREALLPRTVTHDQLPAANALGSFGRPWGVCCWPTSARSGHRARGRGVRRDDRARRADAVEHNDFVQHFTADRHTFPSVRVNMNRHGFDAAPV